MTITLPNERPLSWNKYWSGMHWSARNREAVRVHSLIKYSTLKTKGLFKTLITVKITVFFDKRPYDPDNIAAKPYIDGLKGIFITQDTSKYIDSVTMISRIDKDNPRVEIELKELDGNN